MSKTEIDIFAEIRKINTLSTTLDSPEHTEITDWISTGFYALNACISADLYKGIPCGKITTLFGPSQSGKSVLSALIQKSAQDIGKKVILFDGEWDKDGKMEESFGVDTSKVQIVPINTVEELTIQSKKILDKIIESGARDYIMILDSLGGLSTDKETTDIGKNRVAQDMGLRAKSIRTFYRLIKALCSRANVPFIIINHESKDPSQMYESSFKKQAGGEAIEFFSQVMIHVDKRKERHDEKNVMDELSAMSKGNYTGQSIRFFTQKNRCAAPHKAVECYLNFRTGPDKYSGLIDIMKSINSDSIELKGRTWYVEGEKIGEYRNWRHDEEVWNKILPILNPLVNEEFRFGVYDGT